MRVFVTGTGRCGTKTFANACKHITNYTAGHESRVKIPRIMDRLHYPDNHIEVDNRLVWFLNGRDIPAYPKEPVWNLSRETNDVYHSFMRRRDSPIIKAVRDGIFMNPKMAWEDAVKSYLDIVIDKTHGLPFIILGSEYSYIKFWDSIKAEGDQEAFLEAMKEVHNAG